MGVGMRPMLTQRTKTHFLACLLLLAATEVFAQPIRVKNAASFLEDRALTAGAIVSIFGQNLAGTTAQVSNPASPPTTLGGVTVTVRGSLCGLFYVSPRQVNARLSPGLAPGPATLVLQSPAGTFSADIVLEPSAPGLFSTRGSGSRDGAVLNAVTFDTGPFSVTTNGQPTYLAIYATGLDLSEQPKVSIGGIQTPVQYYGGAPCCAGLQQINAQLLPSLAGAGRVDVAVTAKGRTSNVVDIVILPNAGQGSHPPGGENERRNREIAQIAWIPGTSRVILTDENDDVLRIVDLKEKKTIRTIALPEGSEPGGIAVNAAGTLAVVSLRDMGKVALVDINAGKVTDEVTVGAGPGSIAMFGNAALVVNQESDNLSVVNLATRQVVSIDVGRSPRFVELDVANNRAYVTNQAAGTISVLNLATNSVTQTIPLGFEARPHTFRLLPALPGYAVVTDPTADAGGRVYVLNFANNVTTPISDINPDKSGGVSDIVVVGSTVYFASQTAGAVIAARFSVFGGVPSAATTKIPVDLGARALAVDTLDNWLVVVNQGSGTLVLVDLTNHQVIGKVSGVRGEFEGENEHRDDRSDRERTANSPALASLSPKSAPAGTTFTITIGGTNFQGAREIAFYAPQSLPGQGKEKSKGKGLLGKEDRSFQVSNLQVSSGGTQITATVAIAASAVKGDRLVRVKTMNGESSGNMSAANTFTVQ